MRCGRCGSAVPFHYLFGRTIEVSHLANLVFFALLVVAGHLLACRFTTPWWSVLAALVIATTGLDQVVTGPEALSSPEYEIPEAVTTEAARRAGFEPVRRVALPDGRAVTIWAATPTG